MSGKPTSIAAFVAKQEAEKERAAEAEDKELAGKKVPAGKVWVRLIRPHYDATGHYHDVGAALLDADAVPKSAKPITKAEVLDDDE